MWRYWSKITHFHCKQTATSILQSVLKRIVPWRQVWKISLLFCHYSGHAVVWWVCFLLSELMALKEGTAMCSIVLTLKIEVRLGRKIWEIAVGIKRIHAVMTKKLSLLSVSYHHLKVQTATVHNIWTTCTATYVRRIKIRFSRILLWPYAKNSAIISITRAKTQSWKGVNSSTFTKVAKSSARPEGSKRIKKPTESASLIKENQTQRVRPNN